MERLTFEGNFCDIAQCESVPGGSFCENGGCTQRRVWERLKAYEDTGLTPEEVPTAVEMAQIYSIIEENKRYRALNVTVDRIKELARADREGRVVVLPCKVGDTMWVTGRDNVAREMMLEPPDIRTVCTDEDNLCMATCNRKPDGFCAYRLRNDGSDINKAVFLTREEAEEALRRGENGQGYCAREVD